MSDARRPKCENCGNRGIVSRIEARYVYPSPPEYIKAFVERDVVRKARVDYSAIDYICTKCYIPLDVEAGIHPEGMNCDLLNDPDDRPA